MEFSEKDFPILDALGRETITTQRELAVHTGISLGQVNYVLKSLLERGLVKISNFNRSTRKISYVYRLTPKGLEAKSALAARFVMNKLKEYGEVKNRVAERITTLSRNGHSRIYFVGPPVVGDLVDAVISEGQTGLSLVGQNKRLENLAGLGTDTFDIILVFEGNGRTLKEKADALNLPREKVTAFW